VVASVSERLLDPTRPVERCYTARYLRGPQMGSRTWAVQDSGKLQKRGKASPLAPPEKASGKACAGAQGKYLWIAPLQPDGRRAYD
jgi:hypothetical protein